MQIEITSHGPVVLMGRFEPSIAQSLMNDNPNVRAARDAVIKALTKAFGEMPTEEAEGMAVLALYGTVAEVGRLGCKNPNCIVHDHSKPMRNALKELLDSLKTTKEATPDDDNQPRD